MPKTADTQSLSFKQGDDLWLKLRAKYTVSVPGRYSSLYFLASELLNLASLVPMTYRAHWAMCLFAERMTGIPEIDSAPRQLLLVPRGVGKSSCITKVLPIHFLLRNRNGAIGIANEIQDNADRFLGFIKLAFERNDLLRALFPECIPPNFNETTWKGSEIVINRSQPRTDPSVRGLGVGATGTGAHTDMWLLDDILSKNAAAAARLGNFSEIDKVNQWVTELPPMLSYPATDPILVIGTYWWVGDTYQWLEGTDSEPGLWGHGEKRRTFRWNIKLPDGSRQSFDIYRRGDLAVFCRPIYDATGDSFFPEKLPNDYLATLQAENEGFFASQYLLNPAAASATEFKDSWLRSFTIEGQSIRFEAGEDRRPTYAPLREVAVLISVDPAFSKRGDACKTAIPVTGVWKNQVFLLEDFAEKGLGVHDIANQVVSFCYRYQVKKIFVETITAQVAVADAIRQALAAAGLPYIVIEEIPSHGSQKKAMRIYGLEPFFRTGHFYVRHDAKNFRHEYTTFPRGSARDVLDALAFQRHEWEKLAQYGSTDQSAASHIAADLERIRRNNTPSWRR